MLSLRGAPTSGLLLVRGHVSVHPKLVATLASPKPTRPLTLMLDTGANHSSVLESLLADLGQLVGTTSVRTAPNAVDLPVYRAGLSIYLGDAAGAAVPVGEGLSVLGLPPRPTGTPVPYEGIVGMDLLRHFRLTYDGPAHVFSVSYEVAA
jgi:hypothetical protein